MKLLSLIAVAGLIFTSCSKKDHAGCDLNNTTEVKGIWNWQKTDGGIGYNIHDTPASTGKTIQLVLSDNSYSFYTNGVLTSGGTYSINDRTCIHDGATKRMIDYSSDADTDLMVESIVDNVITLSDENYDGTISIYSRN